MKHKWKDICIQLGIKLREFKMSRVDPFTEGVDYWLKSNTDVPISSHYMGVCGGSSEIPLHVDEPGFWLLVIVLS